MKCYKKDDHWSSCNLTCEANSMWTADGWVKTTDPVWDCSDLTLAGTANTADAPDITSQSPCSEAGDNCAVSQCCSDVGMTCYKKDDHWSACNETCDTHSMWTADGWVKTDDPVWDCEEVRLPCSDPGENCAFSKCCSEPGMKCYKKDDHWSSCNLTCEANSMWTADGWVKTTDPVWNCSDLTLAGTADTADAIDTSGQSLCSEAGDNCAVSQCCSDPGMTCYKKDDHWSACTTSGESCAVSLCCSEPGMKCYKKDDHWSSCNETCDTNSMWTEDGWVKTDDPLWDCS